MRRVFLVSSIISSVVFFSLASLAADAPASTASVPADSFDRLRTTIEAIRNDLANVLGNCVVDRQVSAMATLDHDISSLSADLQKTRDDKSALEASTARLRAIQEDGGSLTVVERVQLQNSKDTLEQYGRRIDELEGIIQRRRTELFAIEKKLKLQLETDSK